MNEEAICWKRSEIRALIDEEIRSFLHPKPDDFLKREPYHLDDEAKENPKCWCQRVISSAWRGWFDDIHGIPAQLNFCPQCGRKL